MGRPLNSKNFGNSNTHSINVTAWTAADSSAKAAYIVKQNATNRYVCKTVNGQGLCTLVGNTPAAAGQMSLKVFPMFSEVTSTAVAQANMQVSAATLDAAGTGYSAGDVVTISGGTKTTAATITVNTVTAGAITTFTLNTVANQLYTVLPGTVGVAVTGGTGTGATFNLAFDVETVTVTAGGAGYVGASVTFVGSAVTTATGTATVTSGAVASITVTSPGSGYETIPTVEILATSVPFEYVKTLTSTRATTFEGHSYFWLPAGEPRPVADNTINHLVFANLDTL